MLTLRESASAVSIYIANKIDGKRFFFSDEAVSIRRAVDAIRENVFGSRAAKSLGRNVANVFAPGVPSRAPLRRRRHFTTKLHFLTEHKCRYHKILKQIRL
jgi:hypothetical protein